MIQPATQPSASSLLLGMGLLPAGTEESVGTGDFAALLLSTGAIDGAAETTEMSADPMAAFTALRQAAGKPAGKSLPPTLPQAEAGKASSPDADAQVDSRNADGDDLTDAAAPQPVLSPAMLTVALVRQDALARSTQAPAMRETPAPSPSQGKGQPAVRPAVAAAAAIDPAGIRADAGDAPQALPVPAQAATATISMPFVVPPTEPAAQAAPVQPTETAIAERAAESMPPVAMEIGTQATAPRTAPRTPAAAAVRPAGSGAAAAAVASPEPPPLDGVAVQAPPTIRTPVVAERTPSAPQPATADAAPAADKARAAAGEPATAHLTAAPPTAAELQPVIALREVQPGVQPGSIDAPRQLQGHLAPHDFAALVDRLLEAREASAPQPVSTAVSHAEFGRIALRFEQNDNGLTVAMNSTDPEFARAVQAAQPAAPAQAGGDNGQNAPRHESAQQHSAASTQPQAQGQAQGQASARGGQNGQSSQPGGARREGQTQDHADDDAPPRRGGIYA